MDTDGGGWIVILRRRKNVTTHVDFSRGWDDYENGFGDLNTEFWLGLRNIHCLTKRDDVELMINLQNNNEDKVTWTYRKFKVNSSSDRYQLHIGEAKGPTSHNDAMAYHDGTLFSTYDDDNNNNCANTYKGGWWFNHCYRSLLTGPYTDNENQTFARIGWHNGGNVQFSTFNYYENVDMKIRPKTCHSKCND